MIMMMMRVKSRNVMGVGHNATAPWTLRHVYCVHVQYIQTYDKGKKYVFGTYHMYVLYSTSTLRIVMYDSSVLLYNMGALVYTKLDSSTT